MEENTKTDSKEPISTNKSINSGSSNIENNNIHLSNKQDFVSTQNTNLQIPKEITKSDINTTSNTINKSNKWN